jgi:hypothetical protein
MFMLALVLGSIARAAGAQRAEVAMPQLRYVAPASCPDRGFFIERMRARLDAAQARSLATLSLRVEIEPRAASMHGSVRIDRGAPSAARTLDGASCREVVEGLALIAALAVTAPSETRRVGSSRSGGGRGVTGAETSAAQGAPAQPSAATSAAQSSDPSRAAQAGEVAVPAPRALREESTASARAAPTSEAVASESGEGPATANEATPRNSDSTPTDSSSEGADVSRRGDPRVHGWAVSAGVLALQGLGPRMQPGLQLSAAVPIAAGSIDWTLRLGGRLALRDTETSTQGSAHFGFASAVVQLCGTGALGGDLTLDGCAVAEPGVLLTSADNTTNPQSYTRGWLAIGAGTGLGWHVARWLSLRAGGEVLAPTRRDRMLLAGQVLHRVPPACVRFGLSFEVPLG